MKRKTLVSVLVALALVMTSLSSAFAATPNEELISFLKGVSSIPTSYVTQAETALNETGTELTSDQVASIESLVNQGVTALNSGDYATVKSLFEKACGIAGFTVDSIVRNADGSYTATVSKGGKTFKISGSKASSASGSTSVTAVSKTGLDNSLFLVAAAGLIVTACGVVYACRYAHAQN